MTDKTRPTLKQICALFIALLPLTKIVSAPSVMAGFCEEKLWVPLVLTLISDIALICLIIYVCKRHSYKNAYQILCESYSEGFAKIIFFTWAVFFLLKAFVPLLEHKRLIENAFYETLPQVPAFYPFFAVCFYVCVKGFKGLTRACEILAPLTVFALLLIIYLSLTPGDYKTLLPLHNINLKSGAIGWLNGILWFNDAIYLIFFIPSFKAQKKPFLKIFICYLIPFLLTLVIFILFYAIFSSIASVKQLAVSSMSIFSLTLVNIGRFDHLAVLILSLCAVFAVTLPVLCSMQCLKYCFKVKRDYILALILCGMLFIAVVIFNKQYQIVI